MGRTRRCQLATLAVLGLVAAACGAEPEDAGLQGTDAHGPLSVVVTTSILGDVTRNVVRDAGTVEVLIPISADPHGYQPSAQQVRAIEEADLVVANGLMLEEQLVRPIESAEAGGVPVLFVAEQVDPIPFGGRADGEVDDDHRDDGHSEEEADDEFGDDDHGDEDPHFWLDPLRMADAARLIGAELAALDPDAADDWNARGERHADELEELHRAVARRLDGIPEGDRKLVTNHEALGYFAESYDFEIVGAVIPGGTTLEEPSAAQLQALAALMEREQVPAIFADTTRSARLADALAAEVDIDVEVVELYTGSLGEQGTDADTYIGMMQVNAERISEALGP